VRVKAEQLGRHLEGGLRPIYVLSGDEPLQIQEARDAVREAARARGFEERVVVHVEARFDWSALREHTDSLSLFSERRVIDLRMPSPSPGQDGGRVLKEYAENPNPDLLLLITTGRADRRTTSTQWFKALEKAGAAVPIWPVDARALAGWIARRAAGRGVRLEPEAAALLADRNEGNLLACAQEIDKLRLLHPGATLGAAEVLDAVSDSARFGAFDLVDTALEGGAARTARIVRTLREEGVEPVQLLGSLAWAIRALADVSARLEAGDALEQVLRGRHGMWWNKRRALDPALRRHDAAAWGRLLRLAHETDRRAKGSPGGADRGVRWRARDAWDALEGLALALGGVNILEAPPYNDLNGPRGRPAR